MTTTIQRTNYSYEVFELRMTVGDLLPWLENIVSVMEDHFAGSVTVSFDPVGVRTEIYDSQDNMISRRDTYLRELGAVSFRRVGNQKKTTYWDLLTCEPREFHYFDIIDAYRFVCRYDHTAEQPIRIRMESDENDVGIRLGGLMEFFGYSPYRRPSFILNEAEA